MQHLGVVVVEIDDGMEHGVSPGTFNG